MSRYPIIFLFAYSLHEKMTIKFKIKLNMTIKGVAIAGAMNKAKTGSAINAKPKPRQPWRMPPEKTATQHIKT
jgi:hypothetical protein